MAAVIALAAAGLTRPFRFVPYGASVPDGIQRSISCDGKVPGTALDCTHWTNNVTPDELYADTSTEIALNLARARAAGGFADFDDATVVNNHYDSDGVLSVYACMQPELSLSHSELLVAGAEAGDFGEWSSEAGVKLDYALSAMSLLEEDDGAAYDTALQRLPALLADLEGGGLEHETLWGDGWQHVLDGWAELSDGRASVDFVGRVALCTQRAREPRLATAGLLHRALAEAGQAGTCTRVLRCVSDGGFYRYEYEKPGHGWVKRLVARATIPAVDESSLAAALSDRLGSEWVEGGGGGLVAICRSAGWCDTPPEAVIEALVAADAGAV